jgi:alkanesulfonate monooxygenase SsuD/methylene tetrahydromethanopterin reductase-like flavin-dependent oxidoreductase (luciferase family)
MSRPVPISVLDLVPVASGSPPATAVANSIDLARRTEAFGYARYWFAEHHLNPGVAGTAPAIMVALAAGATSHIRVGSAGVQMGHRTPLSVVEEFGLLDSAYPGRLDLGLGRTLGTPRRRPSEAAATETPGAPRPRAPKPPARTVDGVLIPSLPSLGYLRHSPRVPMQRDLLQQPDAITPEYAEQIGELLHLLRGSYVSANGIDTHVLPGEGSDVQVWILGSSGGDSADVAGHHGLRFAANYHVSPATVLDAVEGYRSAFRPGGELDQPYICVSADVVVADTEEEARRLTAGYGLWVLGIRSGEGARPYPSPEEAAAHRWTDEDRARVIDRTETQIIGAPAQVADQLERLIKLTNADEVAVTTMTHRHSDRVRSYQLLAAEWITRHPARV